MLLYLKNAKVAYGIIYRCEDIILKDRFYFAVSTNNALLLRASLRIYNTALLLHARERADASCDADKISSDAAISHSCSTHVSAFPRSFNLGRFVVAELPSFYIGRLSYYIAAYQRVLSPRYSKKTFTLVSISIIWSCSSISHGRCKGVAQKYADASAD